jgi:hypothetical protein
MYNYGSGYSAAPRSKRNVPYIAPQDLPDSMFGSVRANPHCHCAGTGGHCMGTAGHCPSHRGGLGSLGKVSLGKLTMGEALGLTVSTPVIVGVSAAALAVSALIQSELDIYFKGFQRGLTRKQVAQRNAALGAAFGIVGAGVLGVIAIKD